MALTESIYEKLTNEEDARVCNDIPDEACRETPGNFVLILATHFLTKLGDAIASPKTTLAWVTSIVGALAPIITNGGVIAVLALMGLAGAALGATLPEVES